MLESLVFSHEIIYESLILKILKIFSLVSLLALQEQSLLTFLISLFAFYSILAKVIAFQAPKQYLIVFTGTC